MDRAVSATPWKVLLRIASPLVWVTWPVRSQYASRRNALGALAVLRQRRREQQDVEEFLGPLIARHQYRAHSG